MTLLSMPFPWIIQDVLVLCTTLFVLIHAAKQSNDPKRTLLEFFAFTFCYAAVYENGATIAGLYDYGRSILMLGLVPFSVPALEFLVLYAALVLLDKFRVPTWIKPLIAGFWGFLQDLSLDPLATSQVFPSEGRTVGRWSWISLGSGDAHIHAVPVYNFPGWILILSIGCAFILLGRFLYAKSGRKPLVGLVYPFLGALAGLLVLVLPTSQFLLWLAPFFGKGSVGEWIMLGVLVAVSLGFVLAVWRKGAKAPLSLKEDWPAILVPSLFHASDLAFALIGGYFAILPLLAAASAIHVLLIVAFWRRSRRAVVPKPA